MPGAADVDSAFAIAASAGAKVIMTLRLREGGPQSAAPLAREIVAHHRSELTCFAIGNEPDVYAKTYPAYKAELKRYMEVLRGSDHDPQPRFCGPGTTPSMAPLTTTVMNSVDQNRAGTASGVNNAISRIAALLAVAAFGALLTSVFQTALTQNLKHLSVSADVSAHVEAQRSKLAAVETDDQLARKAIDEAFVAGYHVVLWIAAGLALASCMSAALLIGTEAKRAPRTL